MATTRDTSTTPLDRALAAVAVPLGEEPGVKAAAARMEETAALAEAARVRLARFETILDPNRRAGGSGESFDELEVLTAHEQVAAVRVEDARARRAAIEARSAHDAAVATERARRDRLLVSAVRNETGRLFAQLDAIGAGANANLALLDEARRMLHGGSIATQAHWPELAPSTPTCESLLACRRRALEAEDLISDK